MIMPKLGNNPERIHFCAETNAKGYTYVRSYKTKWDPVKKQSHAYGKRHVGRLHEDGRVAICASFKNDYPQYAQGDWFWGPDNSLVNEEDYLAYFPENSTPKEALEDEPQQEHTVAIGSTWAMQSICSQNNLLEDLGKVFKEDAEGLLGLAFYEILNQDGLQGYPAWHSSVLSPTIPSLSGEQILEILNRISLEKIEAFYQCRHKRNVANAKKKTGKRYTVFDNTMCSVYGGLLSGLKFGDTEGDSRLLPTHYTMVCDQQTGEVVYTHTYSGSIPEVTLLKTLLDRTKEAGFDWEEAALITDRHYSSLVKVQKLLNLEFEFIQGVRIVEEAVKKAIDTNQESLNSYHVYNSKLKVNATTLKESGTQDSDMGGVTKSVYLHLYRYDNEKAHRLKLIEKVDTAVEELNNGKRLMDDTWSDVRNFVRQETEAHCDPHWIRDTDAIMRATKYDEYFAIRTNSVSDPIEALTIYLMRKTVEERFDLYKNAIDSDTMMRTGYADQGKTFVTTLALSIRLMMMHRLGQNGAGQISSSHSLSPVLKTLDRLMADKTPNANAYVVRQTTKDQRDLFALLGVPLPPKVL